MMEILRTLWGRGSYHPEFVIKEKKAGHSLIYMVTLGEHILKDSKRMIRETEIIQRSQIRKDEKLSRVKF